MPIRRAAGTPPQEQAPPANAPEGEPDASSEESASVGEDQEAPAPAPVAKDGEAAGEVEAGAEATGEGGGEAKEDGVKTKQRAKTEEGGAEEQGKKKKKKSKEGEKKEEKEGDDKAKKVKRTIPVWATMAANKRPATQKTVSLNQPKVHAMLIEAIQNCKDRSGASAIAIMKYIMKKYSSLELDQRKFILKKALKRLVEKGVVKQLKGKGFSGSFKIGKMPANPTNKKLTVVPGVKAENLGDTLPLIMTRLCEPKEASYILIKKYLEQHYPALNVENRPEMLKSAILRAVDRGYLEQITGKGASGTFQVKRNGDKALMKGGPLDDAILTAITAMNEPKSCSITTLRKFLVETHKDQKVYHVVRNLKRTLQKCKMMGWMEQITGSGLSGSYQLSYPYYPSPAILFPAQTAKLKQKEELKRRKRQESSDEEESSEEEEEEEEESEEEPPPPKRKAQKRPAPKARHPPPSKKARGRGKKPAPAKSAAPPAKKPAAPPPKKAAPPARKPVPPAKKPAAPPPKKAAPPARKPVPPAKKPAAGKAAASAKKAPPPAKATPVKTAAPARKPKTPIAKKMTSRASKRPAPKTSPAAKVAAKPAVKAKPAARKSLRARK